MEAVARVERFSDVLGDAHDLGCDLDSGVQGSTPQTQGVDVEFAAADELESLGAEQLTLVIARFRQSGQSAHGAALMSDDADVAELASANDLLPEQSNAAFHLSCQLAGREDVPGAGGEFRTLETPAEFAGGACRGYALNGRVMMASMPKMPLRSLSRSPTNLMKSGWSLSQSPVAFQTSETLNYASLNGCSKVVSSAICRRIARYSSRCSSAVVLSISTAMRLQSGWGR